MRFMIIRKADRETEAGALPSQALVAAMMKYNEEMVNAGGEVQLELRQLYDADDFGEEFTPELRKQEERLRARAAAN